MRALHFLPSSVSKTLYADSPALIISESRVVPVGGAKQHKLGLTSGPTSVYDPLKYQIRSPSAEQWYQVSQLGEFTVSEFRSSSLHHQRLLRLHSTKGHKAGEVYKLGRQPRRLERHEVDSWKPILEMSSHHTSIDSQRARAKRRNRRQIRHESRDCWNRCNRLEACSSL
jgi:hypothetical protein